MTGTSSSRAPSRLALLAPFAVLALIIAIHAAYWMVVSGQIRTQSQAWIADKQSSGYQIAHDGLRVGGYPFRFVVTLDAPDIEAPLADGGWRARFDQAAASAQFYNLNHWIVTLGQTGSLDTVIDGETARYALSADEARLSLRAADGATQRLGAEVRNFAIAALEGPPPAVARIERLVMTGFAGENDQLLARIQTEGTVFDSSALEPGLREAFGDTAQLFRLDAALSDFSALARAGDPLAWTRAGGVLHVNQAQLDWGPAALSGEGDLTLDDLLRPAGRLSVVVSDPESLITALEAAGLVHDEQGAALRLAAMMAPRREAGIALPFRMQDGGLFLGPARIGEVGALD